MPATEDSVARGGRGLEPSPDGEAGLCPCPRPRAETVLRSRRADAGATGHSGSSVTGAWE